MISALILCSALLHAGWNAFVKNDVDRTLSLAWIMGLSGFVSLAAIPFIGLPTPAVWPYLIATTLLQNIYFGLVLLSYRHGDLSQAYPLARGTAALGSAVASSALGIDTLVPREWLGICVSSAGIASLAFATAGSGAPLGRTLGYPLLSGVFTAAYTIVDAMGARASDHPLKYVVWMNIVTAPLLAVYILTTRRGADLGLSLGAIGPRLGAAAVACISYGIAVWAFAHGPIGRAAVLRETSVLFATVLGSLVLKEPFGARRIASAMIILAGFALWP